MEVFNLDLIPGRSNPVIHCSQFDEGRTFRANLFEGSSVYTLTGAETLTLIEKKLDGNMVTISVTNTSDSYVEFATTQQMTALEGEQLCELRIENGGNLIGTLNFLLDCEPSPDTGIASDSAIHNLEAQIAADVALEVANQYDSANVIFDNAPVQGHGIPYTVTSEGIGNAIDNALDMTAEASGAIATFESDYALPLRDLEIEINAVQESGTPTPSSPKAISGFTGANITRCGKNFIDVTKYTTGILSNGSITSTTSSTIANKQSGSVTFITTASWAGITMPDYMFVDNSKVTISYAYSGSSTVWLIVEYYDESKNYLSRSAVQATASGTTFIIPSGCVYVRMSFQMSTVTTATISNIQMEQGSTATTYEAYNGYTTAITWQDEAGTVYGGSLDVTSGVLTVTHGITTINDCITNRTTSYTNPVFYGAITGLKPQTASVKCDYFNVIAGSPSASAFANASSNYDFAINSANTGSSIQVFLRCDDYTDVPTLKTNCGSAVIVYELATPVTYQLTPTQISAIVGTNNVFTDTNGDTSLEYYAGHGAKTAQVAEEIAGVVVADYSAKVVKTKNGTFTNLLTSPLNSVWLICCQKVTTSGSGFVGIYSFDGVNLNPCIVYNSDLGASFDSATGTITVKYSGDTTDVYGSAFRLA